MPQMSPLFWLSLFLFFLFTMMLFLMFNFFLKPYSLFNSMLVSHPSPKLPWKL